MAYIDKISDLFFVLEKFETEMKSSNKKIRERATKNFEWVVNAIKWYRDGVREHDQYSIYKFYQRFGHITKSHYNIDFQFDRSFS